MVMTGSRLNYFAEENFLALFWYMNHRAAANDSILRQQLNQITLLQTRKSSQLTRLLIDYKLEIKQLDFSCNIFQLWIIKYMTIGVFRNAYCAGLWCEKYSSLPIHSYPRYLPLDTSNSIILCCPQRCILYMIALRDYSTALRDTDTYSSCMRLLVNGICSIRFLISFTSYESDSIIPNFSFIHFERGITSNFFYSLTHCQKYSRNVQSWRINCTPLHCTALHCTALYCPFSSGS